MNRQTIEQAADNYAAKATPSYTNGDFDRHAIAEAFECGADWRINSVWHDAREKPKEGVPFIIEKKILEWECVYECWVQTPRDNWEGDVLYFDVTRWAYVSDLLPDGKEDGK